MLALGFFFGLASDEFHGKAISTADRGAQLSAASLGQAVLKRLMCSVLSGVRSRTFATIRVTSGVHTPDATDEEYTNDDQERTGD